MIESEVGMKKGVEAKDSSPLRHSASSSQTLNPKPSCSKTFPFPDQAYFSILTRRRRDEILICFDLSVEMEGCLSV